MASQGGSDVGPSAKNDGKEEHPKLDVKLDPGVRKMGGVGLRSKVYGKKHTEYCVRIKVRSRKHECWRRYRNFLELHRRLAMWEGRPELPPKKAIGHMDEEFVCERRDALEAYLKIVVDAATPISIVWKPLCDFLQVGTDELLGGSDLRAISREPRGASKITRFKPKPPKEAAATPPPRAEEGTTGSAAAAPATAASAASAAPPLPPGAGVASSGPNKGLKEGDPGWDASAELASSAMDIEKLQKQVAEMEKDAERIKQQEAEQAKSKTKEVSGEAGVAGAEGDATVGAADGATAEAVCAVEDDPKFSKFFKMLKMHLPKPAVAMKMTAEGLDPAVLDMDPKAPSPLGTKVPGNGGGAGDGSGKESGAKGADGEAAGQVDDDAAAAANPLLAAIANAKKNKPPVSAAALAAADAKAGASVEISMKMVEDGANGASSTAAGEAKPSEEEGTAAEGEGAGEGEGSKASKATKGIAEAAAAPEVLAPIESPDYDILWEACEEGDVDVVADLIKRGIDVMKVTEEDGYTALHVAADCAQAEVLELICEKHPEVDVDLATKDGDTPLLIACENGCLEVVELLARREADLSRKDADGRTPMFIATVEGHMDVLRLLVEKVPNDLEKHENEGRTPFWAACATQQLNVMSFLMKHQANLDACDNKGLSPLAFAAQQGHFEVVKYLVGWGVDPNAVSPQTGASARDWAEAQGNEDILEFFSRNRNLSEVGGAL